MSTALFLILISSGSIFSAAVWHKRYEEVLPVTCTALVLALFVCGVTGHLLWGAAAVCILAAILYLFSAARVLKTREWLPFARAVFTPAFFIFIGLYAFLAFTNEGKMAHLWDEFSHWMDIVKVMATLDDFGTNPAAHSVFASYPPGMSLFQYMLQKLHVWTTGNVLSEWKAYLAYQVLALSFFFPFLRELRFKRPFAAISAIAIILLSPRLFYSNFYTSIYIDPFLGIVFGAGLSHVLLRDRSRLCVIQTGCCCAMLTLAKDAGLLLAGFLALAFVLSVWLDDAVPSAGRRGRLLASACVIAAVAIPCALWKRFLASQGAALSFSAPYDPAQLLRVALGRDQTWRGTVWNSFFYAFFSRGVTLGGVGITVSYPALCLILLTACGALMRFLRSGQRASKRGCAILQGVLIVEFVAYVVGLCFTYVTRFTEREALALASFERYLNIQYLGVFTFLVILLLVTLQQLRRLSALIPAAALAFFVTITPTLNVYYQLARLDVGNSVYWRDAYAGARHEANLLIPEDSDVMLISQQNNGLDYWVLKYEMRPRRLDASPSWSLGEPSDDEDIWTASLSAEEWRDILVERYDYVVLYRLNDDFYQRYSSVFANPEDIAQEAVYRVDKTAGLLERCQAR